MVSAVKVPRKYVSLNESNWAEVRALWEVGDSTLEDLSARFGVSLRTIQAHLKKHGSAKGPRSRCDGGGNQREDLRGRVRRSGAHQAPRKGTAREGLHRRVAVARLIMAQLDAVQEDPTQISLATNAMKMLSLAAAALERANDMNWRCLGLDRDGARGAGCPRPDRGGCRRHQGVADARDQGTADSSANLSRTCRKPTIFRSRSSTAPRSSSTRMVIAGNASHHRSSQVSPRRLAFKVWSYRPRWAFLARVRLSVSSHSSFAICSGSIPMSCQKAASLPQW